MLQMAWQSLDHNEVLNVRWAAADPNPMAQKREARRTEEQAANAIRRVLPEAVIAELEGRDPEAKKQRMLESNYSTVEYGAADDKFDVRQAQAVDPARITSNYSRLEDAPEDVPRSKEISDSGQGEILSSSTVMALKGYKAKLIKKDPRHSTSLVDYDSN